MLNGQFFMPKKNKSLFTCFRRGIAPLLILSAILLQSISSVAAKVTFRPPGDPAPRRTTGGASRDVTACGFASDSTTTNASVTPVLPKTNIGLTLSEHPTVFVYIPETNAKRAFFSIQDESSDSIYQTSVNLPSQSGVMQIQLPKSETGLKQGKNYKWSLAMICTADLEPDSPVVSGWIRRVDGNNNFKGKENLALTLESASKLAEAGFWYDTLSILAQLRQSQPNNPVLTTSWQDLLTSVELSAIANEPIVN